MRRSASRSSRSAGRRCSLLAQLVFHREALGHAPRSRAFGIVALAILAVAVAPLSMIAGIAAAVVVLVAVAVADTVHADAPAPV